MKNIEGQYIEAYKTFVVLLDNTKLNLAMLNDSVAANKNNKMSRDDEEAPKDLESSSDNKKEAKEKLVAPIYVNIYNT